MRRSIWATLATTLLKGLLVRAEVSTNATCSSNFGWMNNSLGQSPCLVAAYLQGACLNGVWTVPALPHTANSQPLAYTAPDSTTRSLCTCSQAVYNLMSACAACQDEAWLSWGLWQTNCVAPNNLVSPDAFPSQVPVPGGTKIPKYAAHEPTNWTGGSFNATEAQNIGSQDFVATPTSSSSSSASTTSSSDATASDSGSGGGPPVGPIVGGVVGGVLGILLIAVLATFLLCPSVFTRRRAQNANQGDLPHSTGGIPAHPGRSAGTPSTGMINSDAVTISTVSQGHIVAPIPVRPALLTQASTASYSTTSVDHSMPATSTYGQSSTYPQQQQSTLHASQPISSQYGNNNTFAPSPPATASTIAPSLTTARTMTQTPSIRSFLTRVTTRARHIHSSSDSTITSSSSLLPSGPSNNENGNNNSSSRNNSRRQQNPTDHIAPYVLPPTSTPSSAPLTTTLTSSGPAPPVAVQVPAQVQVQSQNHVQPYILDPAFASQQAAGDRKQRPGPTTYGPVEDRSVQFIPGLAINPPPIVNSATVTAAATAATVNPSSTAETAHSAYIPSAVGASFGGSRIDETNGDGGIAGLDRIDRRTNNMSPGGASSILDPAPSYAMATQMRPLPQVHAQTGPAAQYRQTLQGVAEYPEEKATFRGREPEM